MHESWLVICMSHSLVSTWPQGVTQYLACLYFRRACTLPCCHAWCNVSRIRSSPPALFQIVYSTWLVGQNHFIAAATVQRWALQQACTAQQGTSSGTAIDTSSRTMLPPPLVRNVFTDNNRFRDFTKVCVRLNADTVCSAQRVSKVLAPVVNPPSKM